MNKPFYDYKKDGITQSLLGTWLTCRQKALWQLEGWTKPHVSMALTYGTIIHAVLEKVYGQVQTGKLKKPPELKLIQQELKLVEKKWYVENPRPNKYSIDNLYLSLLIAETTLPIYFDYWRGEDYRSIRWHKLEQEFKIPYRLADGRSTFIRGKKDGVFGNPSLKLFETKTKSIIEEDNLVDTLWFEMQVNIYLWAMRKVYKKVPSGVLYNIIRRTGLRRKETESMPNYAKRVAEDIEKRPDFYFIRMEVKVGIKEMDQFEKELEAMVTDFCDWWDKKNIKTYKNTGMCSDKYGRCTFLELCSGENFTFYQKRKQVFNELESF